MAHFFTKYIGKEVFVYENYKYQEKRRGTKKAFISSEEEIINELKRERVQFFILVHNHPSNHVEPSEDDIISTNHLKVRAKRNNLLLLDHIIVSIQKITIHLKNTIIY